MNQTTTTNTAAHLPPRPREAWTLSNVPAAMRDEERWVGWAPEKRGEKMTKVPRCVRSPGRNASSTDPNTWATFDAAEAAHTAGKIHGVGFVLGDGWAGVDLDNCIDADTGEIKAWAVEILAPFRCIAYSEVSPSRKGIKLFGRIDAKAIGNGCKVIVADGAVELYTRGRFFTVTGWALDLGADHD